ncbi:MAG: hypothetical protein IJM57_09525 [Lachnospiraceae bacterium]|nr:hypothetical protein [Lachnospiraceae bacterium]
MNTMQILCVIGCMVVCFMLGRKTKRFRFPVLGMIDLRNVRDDAVDGEEGGIPKLKFFKDLKEFKQFDYVAFKIESRRTWFGK